MQDEAGFRYDAAMNRALTIRVGPRAWSHLRTDGLHPDDLALIPGAAGGAKWLVLKALDRQLFERWLPLRSTPLDLVGSSIGSWRFAAGILGRTQQLFELYVEQTYSDKPDRTEITGVARQIMGDLLTGSGAEQIVSSPQYRLSVMTSRCKNILASENRALLMTGLVAAAGLNALWAPSQQLLFRRHLVHHADASIKWAQRAGWTLEKTTLSEENLAPALLASGSIPLVIEAVSNLQHAQPGRYRDGGLGDYHMPLSYSETAKLVLFPHFSSTFKSGWFDKQLPWRRIPDRAFANVIQVFPSHSFIEALPYGKIPDRSDFVTLDSRRRMDYWRIVERESERLAEEWAAWLEAGCPLDRVQIIGDHGA